MFPTLFLSAFAGVSLPPEVVDQLVGKRVVVLDRQVLVSLSVRTGDPLGSRAEGNQKLLSEPRLVIGHKKTGGVRAGGRQAVPAGDGQVVMEPVGIAVEVTPVLRLDGKIQLDGTVTETEVVPALGQQTKNGFVPGFSERSVRFSTVVQAGQRWKLRVSSRSADDQTWVEFEATVQEPAGVPPPRAK